MRGTKAKRLRKAGLKSGPAPRPELTDAQLKKIGEKIVIAKASYSETRSIGSYGWARQIRMKIFQKRLESNDDDK